VAEFAAETSLNGDVVSFADVLGAIDVTGRKR